ncbi:MAG: hypothetical protein KF896_11515 [Ignavibacteriae bacterium]|nr:hypothetical protein [Ignavibacteriota bacterium]
MKIKSIISVYFLILIITLNLIIYSISISEIDNESHHKVDNISDIYIILYNYNLNKLNNDNIRYLSNNSIFFKSLLRLKHFTNLKYSHYLKSDNFKTSDIFSNIYSQNLNFPYKTFF